MVVLYVQSPKPFCRYSKHCLTKGKMKCTKCQNGRRSHQSAARHVVCNFNIFEMSPNDKVTDGKGAKGKLKEASSNKANERKWILFSKLYDHSAEIDQKYMKTPHYMSERGWLPDWGLQEAMRELLANMIDQSRKVLEGSELKEKELQFSDAPGRLFLHVGDVLLAEAHWKEKMCTYVSSYVNGGVVKAKAIKGEYEKVKTQCVELINYGSEPPWKAFQPGFSSKRDSKTMIGKHGEGLTGASVVLNRTGCNVMAECTHNGFTANVLNFASEVHFQLERRKAKLKGDLLSCTVRFTIVFDPEQEYASPEQLMNSVRLSSAAAAAGVATSRGTLLLEFALRGKQFNRSIFVAEDRHCLFGYNFLDPDKNLLQGRDRNSHDKRNLLEECGAIISEAILQSEEVREEVLKCFLYSKRYDPNSADQEELGQYEDLKDGKYLSSAAVNALRQHHPHGKDAIFCTQNSGKLKEITAATGMNVVYSHRLLHNHVAVIDNFDAELVRDARDVDHASRLHVCQRTICALLGVTQLKLSTMVLPNEQTGFWIQRGVAYFTGAAQLGSSGTVGLSEAQEISLHRTLQACPVPMENIVKIMRLLRNEPEFTAPSTSTDRRETSEATLRATLAAKLLPRSTVSPHNATPAAAAQKAAPVSSSTPAVTTAQPGAFNPMNPLVNKQQPTQMGVTPEQRKIHSKRKASSENSEESYSDCSDSEVSEWMVDDDPQDEVSSDSDCEPVGWDRVNGRLNKKAKTNERTPKMSDFLKPNDDDDYINYCDIDDTNWTFPYGHKDRQTPRVPPASTLAPVPAQEPAPAVSVSASASTTATTTASTTVNNTAAAKVPDSQSTVAPQPVHATPATSGMPTAQTSVFNRPLFNTAAQATPGVQLGRSLFSNPTNSPVNNITIPTLVSVPASSPAPVVAAPAAVVAPAVVAAPASVAAPAPKSAPLAPAVGTVEPKKDPGVVATVATIALLDTTPPATTTVTDVTTTLPQDAEMVENNDDDDDEGDDGLEPNRLVATPVHPRATAVTPTETPGYILPDPPASISLGSGRPCVHRLSRHAATGVWLYSDTDEKKTNPAKKMTAQLEWCVPAPMGRHKLLLLSCLVHIVVFTTADASAALVFSSEGHCVCVLI